MARFDSADLVATVQQRGRVPIVSVDWTTANILKVISEEAEALFPEVVALRGEYNLLTQSQAVVSGTSRYRIPKRAFDNAIREVWLQEVATGRRVLVTQVAAEELTALRADMDTTGTPSKFWVDDGAVELYPVPDQSAFWRLHIRFHPRPSLLVQSTAYHTIDAIDRDTPTTLSFATPLPTGWDGATKQFDIVRGTSPFSILATDISLSVDPTLLSATLAPENLPVDVTEGDYLVLTGTTPFLNMPESFALPAALNAAAAIVGPQGDDGLKRDLRKEAAEKLKDALAALDLRVKAPMKKLNNRRWF